jgi:hypothetical protein
MPGSTALQVMPWRACSSVVARIRPISPALVAE